MGWTSYLIAAVIYTLATPDCPEITRTRRLMFAAMALGIGFAPPLLLARAIPDLACSRWTFAAGGGIAGLSLGLLAVLNSAPRLLLAIPAEAVVTLVMQGRSLGATPELNIDTQFYALQVQTMRPAPLDADTVVEGGGLARLDDGMVLVSGAGRFAHLARGGADTAWRVRPLDVPDAGQLGALRCRCSTWHCVQLVPRRRFVCRTSGRLGRHHSDAPFLGWSEEVHYAPRFGGGR